MLIKGIVIIMLLFILLSLGSAFISLIRGQMNTTMVKALTLRIALSLLLFIGIIIGFKTGLLTPNQGPF